MATDEPEIEKEPKIDVAGDEEDEFSFQLRLEEEERKRQAAIHQQSTPSSTVIQESSANSTTTAAASVTTESTVESAVAPSNGVEATADGKYIYTDPNDGTIYEYDYEKKAWIPKIDDDFIARYQAQYGVYDAEQQAALAQQTSSAQQASATVPKPNQTETKERELPPDDLDEEGKKEWFKQRKKEKRKLTAERGRQQAQWFDIDETQNTNVYVSGLPHDIDLKEFEEIMTKCGVIALDIETRKPKLKLYRDSDGNPKGDGLCCYVKKESIELATTILDGSDVRGQKLSVEVARFELKGAYDPAKKRKKLSSKQKRKVQERTEKMFDWRPEKLRGERPKSDCTVIIRGLFTLDELAKNYLSLQASLKEQCAKYGEVRKVFIFDNNPEGIASVKFKTAEDADDCIKMMDWRHFEGKRLRAERYDGKTNYKIEETEEERQNRLAKWQNYIDQGAAAEEAAGGSGVGTNGQVNA